MQMVEAIVSVVAAIIALVISNGVLATYVVMSGSDLYASDSIGARMFAGLALLTTLGIRTYEHWLSSDTARSRYALTFFVIGVCASALWAGAMAKLFAPSANAGALGGSPTNDGWIGVLLVLAHVVGDAAWGYILLAGAEKVLLGNRKRIEVANPHYAVAEAQAARTKAAEDVCHAEIAEADGYIAAVAHARTRMQAGIELELDRRVALWHAQQEAGVALARAHFLNTK